MSAKTDAQKIVEANATLTTALDAYITTIDGLRGSKPDVIEQLLSGVHSAAGTAKSTIERETRSKLIAAQHHYTANAGYTADDKTYIDTWITNN